MSNTLSIHLFQLVKSLSKAEKRHFKLYASRNSSVKDKKFIRLFDALNKMKDYSEEKLSFLFPRINTSHLSNLKAHLYEQILQSQRILHQKKNEFYIRTYLDYARVLYDKGLYMQSLLHLEKAKQTAQNNQQNVLMLEIAEFEKL
ncbi:MAG: hypothetical protein ACHQHP_05340, partial [Bacteroidia bacterium]